MSWFLYRLGRWSFRRRWIVIATWIAALLGAGVAATTLSGQAADEFSVPGMESIDAFELIKERTPDQAPDGAYANVVFQAPEGETLEGYADVIDDVLATVPDANLLVAQTPFESGTVSADGRTGYATVQFDVLSINLDEADREALEEIPESAENHGLLAAVGGDAMEVEPELGAGELVGVAVALVVLVVALGTFLAGIMPIVSGIVGVGIGVSLISAATGFLELGATTPILATMLGLAVGIDYALFIVSRYRHEVGIGRDPEDAAGRAVGTAGSAVIFAGLTVMIALVGLSIVQISFLTQMGIAAAFTVGIAVLVAITLLPALFGLAGRRILRSRIPFLRNNDPEADDRVTVGRRWAQFVTRRKGSVFVVGLAVAAVAAIPVGSMQLAMPDQGSAPEDSSPRVAYDLIAENFGPGANGPLTVVIDVADADDPHAVIDEVNATVASFGDDVALAIPAGPQDPSDPEQVGLFEQMIQGAGYVTAAIIPETGPADAETQDLVDDLRAALSDTEGRALVTGPTAIMVDFSELLADAFPRYLVVVVGLAFVLLIIVFRSIWIPVKAVLGFLISILVALGVMVAVTQWGWGASLVGIDDPGPIVSMFPILLTGILFGLAMDYELFLVSRMREEYAHGAPSREAIITGFQHGSRVVTAAAIIMISVFGSFAFMDDPIITAMGLGLAVGILADAFLVRMTLVPAVMAIVGDRIWWIPAWLDRILPDVDLEGERLTERLGREGREPELASA